MAYQLRYTVNIDWIPDGAGSMSVPSAQTLQAIGQAEFGNSISVPGADAPTTGNISTACTALGTQLAAQLNASIAQIQGFATGGG